MNAMKKRLFPEQMDGFARAPRRPKPGRASVLSCLALLTLNLLCGTGSAQNYTIDWHSITAEAGFSTAGNYSVSGAIGQDESTAPMAGGNFSLSGGVLSLLSSVQTAGAPPLKILVTSTNTAVLSWPSASTGFVLQQSARLGGTNWTTVSAVPVTNGATQSIVVQPVPGNHFYRLFKP